MNKDVIYIEPENDITDIIAKIENAKERIVALVPPKNPAVLRSIVNIKLIMKAASTHDKTVVLVTADSSIIKLAAATRIPVTKNLQSAPTIPVAHEEEIKTESTDEVVETAKGEVEVTPADTSSDVSDNTPEDGEASAEVKPAEPAKEPAKNTKIGAFLAKYKRWCLLGAIALVVFIVFLIWALVIAPAVNIVVTVRTTSNNFSENITFTTNVSEEDAASGKFYLEEKKLETPVKIEFKATGTKNIGEKATGELIVYHYFNSQGTANIPAGTNFTHDGHVYTNSADTSIAWDGTFDQCDNDITKLGESCVRSVTIKITATEPGEKYNLAENSTGWTSSRSGISVSRNPSALAGGTDKVVTIVQQSDIDEAKKSITSGSESEAKAKLLESMGDGMLAIESSFKQTTSEITSSPKLGEEVAEGVTPAIETTTVASIFAIDKTKVEEFISSKARLSEDQKIYQLGNPFIENFLPSDSSYTGKLKTSYASGPKVTEEDIMNKSKGKKIGEVQSLLKSINGVSTVSIEKSFFWVNSVPNDPNKITINLSLGE